MPHYIILPLDADTCRHVREERTDPIYGYDYDVMASVAGPGGYGPCRRCLRKFVPGERRLLFLHNPFGNDIGDFGGPVFIHEQECTPVAGGAELPDELNDLALFLRSYDEHGHFVEHAETGDTAMAPAIETLFANAAAHEVHIRNCKARCYVAKAVRHEL